jgi:hypothetical protein
MKRRVLARLPPMAGRGGLFLGRAVDPASGETGRENFLLGPDDLTTHGLIVGMTGSGKTALGIVLIEELLKAGVPVLAVDPKGDLGNLLLAFPGLTPAEFAPWIDGGGGATAEWEAKRWTDGLAAWGLGPSDVAAYAAAREAAIYTPGSSAGIPLDLVGACPPPPEGADDEDRRDVVTAFASGILGLAGIEADPVRSRELILLAACVDALWEKGETARLESLVPAVATPPFPMVGALPLETFYPARERQALVLALNNVVASPATAAFRKGVPLDVGTLLAPGAGGRPRLSIISVAHLSDAERLFVVATLLARVKAWVRSQPGSSSLKALLYVDEIFGFFPPSASPPTKPPLLTLLKQARAFGFGVVLATQNPVDLDYKGLANCGCWWVGTLQTERDRDRLATGLSEAGGGGGVPLLGKTRKRVFLLHDVHAKGPVLMETRWAMSYLRGPMTRDEIARVKGGAPAPAAAEVPATPGAAGPPPIPAPWTAKWVLKRGAEIANPYLYAKCAVRYRVDARTTAPETTLVKLFPLAGAEASDVLEGDVLDVTPTELRDEPFEGRLRYADLPPWLGPSTVKALERSVKERLPDKLAATLLKDPVTGSLSLPGESGESFARRIAGAAVPAALTDKLEQKRRALAAAEAQETSRELETAASVASAAVDLIGGLLGKRKSLRVRRVGSVLTKRRLEGTAESRVEALRAEVEQLSAKVAPPDASRFESVAVVPAKAHMDLLSIGVAWVA